MVGSENQPKCRAVRCAFEKVFQHRVDVMGVKSDSGVGDHPVTAETSIMGAINRAKHAQVMSPGADYYVGIEGGLLQAHGRAWEHGWVAVMDKSGRMATGVSAGLELRGEILTDILAGKELSDIMQDRFQLEQLGKKNGYYGVTTDNLITRETGYVDAIIFALAPFKHPEYFQ